VQLFTSNKECWLCFLLVKKLQQQEFNEHHGSMQKFFILAVYPNGQWHRVIVKTKATISIGQACPSMKKH
jgi:hypothetical protein